MSQRRMQVASVVTPVVDKWGDAHVTESTLQNPNEPCAVRDNTEFFSLNLG